MIVGFVRRGFSSTGGAESYLKRFASALRERGDESVLFASGAWTAEEFPWGKVQRIGGSSPTSFADALRAAEPRKHCDVLFSLERVWECDCYRAGDGVHRAWLEERAKYQPAWKRWFRDWNPKHREILRLERRMFTPTVTSRVIANSHWVKNQILRSYGYPAERMVVVHNGIPPIAPPTFEQRTAARAAFDLKAGELAIVFAGSGWERKGLRFAIEAVDHVRNLQPRLLVAGRGTQAGLPRSDRVQFLGGLSSTAIPLAAADLFLLPTTYDPFSNACLEAAASGVPVITTACNGFAEVMQQGLHGEVVDEPSNITALAQAIKAWADEAKRERARPVLQALAERFSIEANVTATLEVLQDVESR